MAGRRRVDVAEVRRRGARRRLGLQRGLGFSALPGWMDGWMTWLHGVEARGVPFACWYLLTWCGV